MKDVDIEKEETVKVDIENAVLHLFKAYPAAKYIALNTALTAHNQFDWKDHWYFIGFIDEPMYQELDGFPEWVAYRRIHKSQDEWGLFFMHVSSKDLLYRGVPIQTAPDDFASPRFFCWQLNEDGKTMTQIISDEIVREDDSKQVATDFRDMVMDSLVHPIQDMIKRRDKR